MKIPDGWREMQDYEVISSQCRYVDIKYGQGPFLPPYGKIGMTLAARKLLGMEANILYICLIKPGEPSPNPSRQLRLPPNKITPLPLP